MKAEHKKWEQIIDDEIVVDCYSDEEVKMGWYTWMGDQLTFPFGAKVPIKKKGGKVERRRCKVVGLASDKRFGQDMEVEVEYQDLILTVPLLSVQVLETEEDEDIAEAIKIWQYWNTH